MPRSSARRARRSLEIPPVSQATNSAVLTACVPETGLSVEWAEIAAAIKRKKSAILILKGLPGLRNWPVWRPCSWTACSPQALLVAAFQGKYLLESCLHHSLRRDGQ